MNIRDIGAQSAEKIFNLKILMSTPSASSFWIRLISVHYAEKSILDSNAFFEKQKNDREKFRD